MPMTTPTTTTTPAGAAPPATGPGPSPAAAAAVLELDDGLCYPARWLRDNCPCPRCADPDSGQKLFSITDLPPDVRIAESREHEDHVDVVFTPDGHRASFGRSWLGAHRLDGAPAHDDRAEDAKHLWHAADLAQAPPTGSWDVFQHDPAHRAACLDALLRFGFVLLHDVPTRERAVLAVAEGFGYVRRTNYGDLFDVRVEHRPTNLAFSSLPISPHTDNPYRDPVPTVQFLHCLVNAAQGGDSGLVDGFRAAADLREQDPGAFDLLAGTPVTFRYADQDTELTATRPLIGLDPSGRIKEIRFNNRSMRPLALPAAQVDAYYAAYRRFAEILSGPQAQLAFRLEPGDCVVFDNTRVLHARTGFLADGARHLQGCYADLDAVASSLAVLRRSTG
ncbi:MAG TPA: TauD/TfdA family dioxygenase [Actinocrinis sp.]|nr:TauD/TfdA family dioxygenase [Actinocrinis sp.]